VRPLLQEQSVHLQPQQYANAIRQQPPLKYDDTKRNASRPAGPGRGHTGKRNSTALEEAEGVLKKSRPTLREAVAALGHLTEEHRLLKQWYQKVQGERDRAFALLRADYLLGANEKTDAEFRKDRRALVMDMVGEGYDFSGSHRTFKRHKALAVAYIQQLAGKDNTMGQQQLAEALMCHYKSDNKSELIKPTTSVESEAQAAVISGLVETLETLRKRNNGRFPTKDRITQEVILTSVISRAKGKVLSAISRLLNQSRDSLSKAKKRAGDLFDPERAFFREEEASCNAYNKAWTEFVERCWDDLTRASECTKDEVRDPVAHSSGAHHSHRIHWIHTRLDDMRDIMLVMGIEEFGEDFHLSKPKMLGLKKYYHRYPGRNTCLCRYHMAFDHHFTALRKWKALARQHLPMVVHSTLVKMPESAREFRQFLQCEKVVDFYKQGCTNRTCSHCKHKLSTLFTPDELLAIPRIKYQHWGDVPYVTKDGRELKNQDFLPAESSIGDYILMLDEELAEFLPHHNRAKYLDSDWKKVWSNISRVDDLLPDGVEHWWELPEDQWATLKSKNQFATVIDYANSYESEHLDEHMQQFWSHGSTTMLGCVMKVPLSKLKDSFFAERARLSMSGRSPTEERMEVLHALAANHLPPEITVMHIGVTSNPHHDTAGIQHFLQHNLYPWLQEHTTLEGAYHIVRSDGCAGQMKSGRHFRFIANFHTLIAWNMQITLIWSHSESCHGKDLSDPECGRAKFVLRCHEMRHTADAPTMLKTSREHYDFLVQNHCLTRRSLAEKKGRGIYMRAFHWMPAKSIRPLSGLAEVDTLEGSVTMKSHFFINCGQTGYVQVREIACLTCTACVEHRCVSQYRSYLLEQCDVGIDFAPMSRSVVVCSPKKSR